jgi:hypothetical protein
MGILATPYLAKRAFALQRDRVGKALDALSEEVKGVA